MDHPGIYKNLGPLFTAVDVVVFTISTITAITAVGKGFVVTEVSYGLGQHRSQLSVGQYQQYLKYDFLDWAQFFIALLVTKISICLFLTRLSQFHRLRAVLYGLMGFLFVTHIPLFFIYVFQCSPVRRAWQRDVGGKCMSKDVVENVIIAQGVFSLLTDFVCAVFPAILLWNVKIRTKTKIGANCKKLSIIIRLTVYFSTGGIAIARTAFAWQTKSENISCKLHSRLLSLPAAFPIPHPVSKSALQARETSADTVDQISCVNSMQQIPHLLKPTQWDGIPGALTRVFEVNIGIIAACAPVLRPFVRYTRARLTGRDPHNILRGHFATHSFHSSWYTRFWPSRSSPRRSTPTHEGIEAARDGQGGGIGDSGVTAATLNLPIQGVKAREDSRGMPVFPLKMYGSRSVSRTGEWDDEFERRYPR
ncbi:MAG: hypothetical protein L6R40_008045 [Gallowayella cf. fulva]|nr:MAG: hypothetical protein L6R40_008045 [Xanthomendoza cf. fulva]